MKNADDTNRVIREASPALHACLSELGQRTFFPADIPFQAAQARGKELNATIGQITDGRGKVAALPAMEELLAGLTDEDRNRALLYSPVEGIPEARQAWRQRQRRGVADDLPSTNPFPLVGLTYGLALAADLFGGPGRTVAVPEPFWGNYRQTFATRTGARMVTAPAYVEGRFHCEAIEEALAAEPEGEPALALLNFPSNPGGYSPTPEERERLKESLRKVAEQRPLLVVCDDAYAGLVYEEGIPSESIFWELIGLHPGLVPVKLDGATKELTFFGGRIGYLTFPFPPDSPVAQALESKMKCLLRATAGSPVAVSQMLLLAALRRPDIEEQVAAIREMMAGRYRVLRDSLERMASERLRTLPFNSGCFALLELMGESVPLAEDVRQHLLAREDVGLVSIGERYLRIAFCSVEEAALAELVKRIERGVEEVAGQPGL